MQEVTFIDCPYCNERGMIPVEFLGQSLRCKKCKKFFASGKAGEVPDEIGLVPLTADENQQRQVREQARETGANRETVQKKQEARALALAWWTKRKRDFAPGTWQYPTCEACGETLPPVEGYLCVPWNRKVNREAVFACEACYKFRKYEPWDPKMLERRLREDEARKEEEERHREERRRLEEEKRRGPAGPPPLPRCYSCQGVIQDGQCSKCGIQFVRCGRCRRLAMILTKTYQVCTLCGYQHESRGG